MTENKEPKEKPVADFNLARVRTLALLAPGGVRDDMLAAIDAFECLAPLLMTPTAACNLYNNILNRNTAATEEE